MTKEDILQSVQTSLTKLEENGTAEAMTTVMHHIETCFDENKKEPP